MAWFKRHRREDPAPAATTPPPVFPTEVHFESPEWNHPDRWRTAAWDQPDLIYAKEHAASRHQDWDLYGLNLELVPCDGKLKPAMFFKIGYADFEDWVTSVVPVGFRWDWRRTEGATAYVVIDLHVLFHNRRGTSIGTGGAGQVTGWTVDDHQHAHRFRSRTLLDPADPAHREVIEAWAAGPAPTMLFFVEERLRNTGFVTTDLHPEDKQSLVDVLATATAELGAPGIRSGGFADACAQLCGTLPRRSWWR